MNLSCGILGLGRAGRSLLLSADTYNLSVDACFSRRENPLDLINLHKKPSVFNNIQSFIEKLIQSKTQILILAVPDDVIGLIAHTLSEQSQLPPLVIHLSGAQSYDALATISHLSKLAQFHPLVSLSGEYAVPAQSFVGICADSTCAHETAAQLAKKLQLSPASLEHGSQTLYHAAAVLTGNLSLGLVIQSLSLMKKAGIDEKDARPALAKLLRSVANTLEHKPVEKALTGPLARGDFQTIHKHLEALAKLSDPDIEMLYRTLSQVLVKHDDSLSVWSHSLRDSHPCLPF